MGAERGLERSAGPSAAQVPSSAGSDLGSAPGAGTEGRITRSLPTQGWCSAVPPAAHAAQRGLEAADLGRCAHLPFLFFCETLCKNSRPL